MFRRMTSLALAAIMLIASGSAFAATISQGTTQARLPGVACQPRYHYSEHFGSFTGRLDNLMDVRQYWQCPMVSRSAGQLDQLRVTVVDRTSNDRVTCTVYVRDAVGTRISSSTRSTGTSFNSSTPTTLTFSNLNAPSPTSAFLHCIIPGAVGSSYSGIMSYAYRDGA